MAAFASGMWFTGSDRAETGVGGAHGVAFAVGSVVVAVMLVKHDPDLSWLTVSIRVGVGMELGGRLGRVSVFFFVSFICMNPLLVVCALVAGICG